MKRVIAASAIAMCAAVPARAEVVYALTSLDQLITFDSFSPGTLLSAVSVTGLQMSESVWGIDYRPSTGQLYALGSSSRLYTINPTTGAATQIGGQFSTILNGTTFGFDVNPQTDRIRVVSDLDQNLVVNPNSGAVEAVEGALFYSSGDLFAGQSPNVNGAAYNNNVPGASSTTLYVFDSLQNTLAVQNPANLGQLTTIGPLGIDGSRFNGFDISGATGIAYAATPASSGGPAADLYTVNLVTGQASLIGHIGQPDADILVRGLAVAAVPEPDIKILAIVGGAAFWMLRMRRRA